MNAPSIVPKIALGAALLGATAGVVGSFAVLRRRSLLGDTLAHAALPGICLAHLLFATRDLFVLSFGALVAGLLGVVFVVAIPRWTRIREDAALGLVLSTFFGAGVVLLSITQHLETGAQAGLDSYLFGEVAGLRNRDIIMLSVVAVLAISAAVLLVKELKLLCFDEGFATAQGWPAFAIDLGVMSAVAVVTIISLPVCGVVLMAAVLIFPCVTARYWSDSFGVVLTLSGFLGASAAALGVISVVFAEGPSAGLPPGPMIVLTSAALFVVSMLFAPQRGFVARSLVSFKVRIKVVSDHLLRALFEITEEDLPDLSAAGDDELSARVPTDSLSRWIVLRLARWRGWVESPSGGGWRLTEPGLEAAASVVRAHRLWELFLVSQADIAADHVHRPADEVEHYLSAELVASLEEQLAREGRLPPTRTGRQAPQSPH